jgi:hypothetical protein
MARRTATRTVTVPANSTIYTLIDEMQAPFRIIRLCVAFPPTADYNVTIEPFISKDPTPNADNLSTRTAIGSPTDYGISSDNFMVDVVYDFEYWGEDTWYLKLRITNSNAFDVVLNWWCEYELRGITSEAGLFRQLEQSVVSAIAQHARLMYALLDPPGVPTDVQAKFKFLLRNYIVPKATLKNAIWDALRWFWSKYGRKPEYGEYEEKYVLATMFRLKEVKPSQWWPAFPVFCVLFDLPYVKEPYPNYNDIGPLTQYLAQRGDIDTVRPWMQLAEVEWTPLLEPAKPPLPPPPPPAEEVREVEERRPVELPPPAATPEVAREITLPAEIEWKLSAEEKAEVGSDAWATLQDLQSERARRIRPTVGIEAGPPWAWPYPDWIGVNPDKHIARRIKWQKKVGEEER